MAETEGEGKVAEAGDARGGAWTVERRDRGGCPECKDLRCKTYLHRVDSLLVRFASAFSVYVCLWLYLTGCRTGCLCHSFSLTPFLSSRRVSLYLYPPPLCLRRELTFLRKQRKRRLLPIQLPRRISGTLDLRLGQMRSFCLSRSLCGSLGSPSDGQHRGPMTLHCKMQNRENRGNINDKVRLDHCPCTSHRRPPSLSRGFLHALTIAK